MTQINEEYVNLSPYKLGQFGDQLENMTAQEVFNIAVEHLLLQNKQSKDDDNSFCMYNGSGICCAAAPFIKDHYYKTTDKGKIELLKLQINTRKRLGKPTDLHEYELQQLTN